MEIFGIGPLELVLIVLVAIVVLGPKEMMSSAQKAATWLRKLRKSELWSTTKEVMDIPNQVMKETGLDKEIKELKDLSNKSFSANSVWTPDALAGNTIHTPKAEQKTEKPKEEGTETLPDSSTETPTIEPPTSPSTGKDNDRESNN